MLPNMSSFTVIVFYNVVMLLLALGCLWAVAHARARLLVFLASTPLLFTAAALGAFLAPVNSMFPRMQMLAWTVFIHWPLFLGVAALRLLPRGSRTRTLSLLALGATLLVGADAFFVEPHWLEVTTLELPAPGLSQPLRIALVTDLQTDAPGDYEARALQAVKAARPDLILFGGDYVQVGGGAEYLEAMRRLNAILRQADLQAPLGMYAVIGSTDRASLWRKNFAAMPVTLIDEASQRLDLGPVILTALSSSDAYDPALWVSAAEKYHIVLGHSPNFSLGQVNADLLLAGHTHGGQVRLPFIGPLITLSDVPRAHAAGVTQLAPGKTLIVSRGIGMERYAAPRLRFLCRPQLVIIDLLPAAGQ